MNSSGHISGSRLILPKHTITSVYIKDTVFVSVQGLQSIIPMYCHLFGRKRSPAYIVKVMLPMIIHIRIHVRFGVHTYMNNSFVSMRTSLRQRRAEKEIDRLLYAGKLLHKKLKGNWTGTGTIKHMKSVMGTSRRYFAIKLGFLDK